MGGTATHCCITSGLWQSSGFLGVILGCLWPFVRFSHYFVIGAFLNFSFSLRFHCFRALFVIVEIICKFVHFVGPKFDSNTEEQVRKIAFPKSHVFSCHLTGVGHVRILQIILHNQEEIWFRSNLHLKRTYPFFQGQKLCLKGVQVCFCFP